MSRARSFRILVLAALAGVLTLASAPFSAHGHESPSRRAVPDQRQWLEVSQKALGNLVGDYRFVETKGATVSLDSLQGKPVVFSLIYTSCSHVCPMITQRLRRAVEEAQRVIGSDRFTVVTVGFDVRNDTPMRMAAFARAQGVDFPNWLFLSGDDASVSKLAEDLGFSYTAMAGGFLHAAQTTIVDRDGRVYRHVYGDDFPIQMFMEPLKEAVYGTVGTFLSVDGLFDRIRFICTVYDPNQGRYRISYAIAMTLLTGVISLSVTALVISRAWLKSRRA
ncbi:MAG: SCO family protein [Bradyrhizobiaceae bacterium]|nr:SCO family protein [Bradyrhizobiaceae bacterium]